MATRKSTWDMIQQIASIIEGYYDRGYSMTVRQAFYQLVAKNSLPNSQRSYNKTSRLVTKGRRTGIIPWSAIVDRGRLPIKPGQYKSMDHFAEVIIDIVRIKSSSALHLSGHKS